MPLKPTVHCLPHSRYWYILIFVAVLLLLLFVSHPNFKCYQKLKLRAHESIRKEDSEPRSNNLCFLKLYGLFIPCFLFSIHACFPDCFSWERPLRNLKGCMFRLRRSNNNCVLFQKNLNSWVDAIDGGFIYRS